MAVPTLMLQRDNLSAGRAAGFLIKLIDTRPGIANPSRVVSSGTLRA
jgi:hypothetical protein